MTIKDTAKTVLAKADKVISGFDDQKEKQSVDDIAELDYVMADEIM